MDRPSSSSSSSMRPLPVVPPSVTAAEAQTSPSISKRLSNTMGRLSMQSKRASNVPRPEPIPIPEPVTVPATESAANQNQQGLSHTVESSGEGPSSTSSTGSALASVSAELIQHGVHSHSHSGSGSPSSPRETNQLLGDQNLAAPTPRVLKGRSNTYTATAAAAADPSSPRPPPSTYDQLNRPYSSADAWATPSDSTAQPPTVSASRSPSSDSLIRPSQMQVPRSRSTNFGVNTPSPLNPNSASTSNPAFSSTPPPLPPPQRRPTSSASRPASTSSRPGSMVLYRLAGIGDDFNPQMASLSPPVTTNSRRASRFSTLSSGNSTYSIFADSKYPVPAREEGSLTPPPSGAFLPYEYDPSWDQDAPDDAEDVLHRPDEPGQKPVRMGGFNVRGMCNVFVMVTILLVLIGIFVLYPVVSHYDHAARASLFSGTDNGGSGNSGTSNSTNQRTALIDPDTPSTAQTWTSIDGTTTYQLVFSDEFKTEGRTFGQGEDPFWEAVGLHDAKNDDLNYYDPGQVTTKGGYLQIKMEQKTTGGYTYTSGMLQSWNKFCFTGGYVEISVSLPGSSQNTGFTPQAYTMGNLVRSGYGATESGVWPYSYDTCDTNIEADQAGGVPSKLPAQRLSACTCPAAMTAGEHPGPTGTTNPLRGRGAPQIDILGYLDANQDPSTISQSYRFAPFNTDTTITRGVTVESPTDTTLNTFTGTTSQQIISALNNVSTTSYGGASFSTFGYEHVTDTATQTQAALHWVEGGSTETFRITGTALAADTVVGQRLIANEPMYLVFSLALSTLVATPDTTALTFPATFLVDYVRVYQIQGQATQVTCDPTDFPTKDYINNHQEAYNNSALANWAAAGYTDPTNSKTGTC